MAIDSFYQTDTYILSLNKHGNLQNGYSPLKNLINSETLTIGDFTTKELKFNKNTTIDLIISDEYDGSRNIILNDDVNTPKLINDRFSVQENKTFEIPIHNGNYVTNVYDEIKLNDSSNLIKLYNNIPDLEFLGLEEGGAFKCGSYVFYFKLSDADGNMTNIIQESGLIQVHIGQPNSTKIRMGLQDENAQKCIRLKLNNIDSAFDYIRIFYERQSSDNSQAVSTSYYMIDQNFPINSNSTEILLTGNENVLQISEYDIKTQLADIGSAKTQIITDSVLFLGNISSTEIEYQKLQQIAWKIIPRIKTQSNVGSQSQRSESNNQEKNPIYYNVKNVYDYTGYWEDEFYRFGIVFIFDNNQLSETYNIQGCEIPNDPKDNYYKSFFENNDGGYVQYIHQPEDYFFDKSTFHNSKGVCKLPKLKSNKVDINGNDIKPKTLSIEFDFSKINVKSFTSNKIEYVDGIEDIEQFLIKNHIKGFFFVRQKRIPTVLAQGVVVGLTNKDHGCIPVLKDYEYETQSFLHSSRLLRELGTRISVPIKNVSNKALLVPDYELNNAAFNQIFTSQKFTLDCIGNYEFWAHEKRHTVESVSIKEQTVNDVKVTAVPYNTITPLTDGQNYFSSVVGDPNDPVKTADVKNVWNKTFPQDLSVANTLIRGKWGAYVGIDSEKFNYGDVVNIKINNLNEHLEFQKRFNDYSLYSAISTRYNVSQLRNNTKINCYRGDCFVGLFTHRMMSNFIDPELPTNHKIINPTCWMDNYMVRTTAEIMDHPTPNLMGESTGFYIPAPAQVTAAFIIKVILTGQFQQLAQAAKLAKTTDTSQKEFANEVCKEFEIKCKKENDDDNKIFDGNFDITSNSSPLQIKEIIEKGWIRIPKPSSTESSGIGGLIKAIFTPSAGYELRGIGSINRADVNAVSIGEWITFPICSSYNLAMRDIDFSNPTEEAAHNRKRSFYPYSELNIYDNLPESNIINGAAKISLSNNKNPVYIQVPFIKQEFFNRIYWSKPNITQQFANSYRVIFDNQFREYNKEFGAITKILSLGNSLVVVLEHGIGTLPINKNPQNDKEQSPYLSSVSVLPNQLNVLTSSFGSMWKDSIIKTYNNFIYGVDTVAKKIWRIHPQGNQIEIISDHVINKFLNENITLSEYDHKEYAGHINVKTHYNQFKNDLIFTYYKDTPVYDENKEIIQWEQGKTWSLCYNEILNKFITFYDWYPVESCNIDNIFFSFDKEQIDETLQNKPKSGVITKINQITLNDKIYKSTELNSIFENYSLKQSKVDIDQAFNNNIDVFNIQTDCVTFQINTPVGFKPGSSDNFYASMYIKVDIDYEDDLSIDIFDSNNTPLLIYDLKREVTCNVSEKYKWKFVIFRLINTRYNYCIKISSINWNIVVAEPKIICTPVDLFQQNEHEKEHLKFYDQRDSENSKMLLWKHGQAGLFDAQGKIKPTFWYGKQHEFNFEFVVNEIQQTQKIFNNLKIISNKTAPNKFEYEIVGEGYDWYDLKPLILTINKDYKYLLTETFKDESETIKNELFEKLYLRAFNSSKDETKTIKLKNGTIFDLSQYSYSYYYPDETVPKKIPYLYTELTDKKGCSDITKSYSQVDYWDNLSKTIIKKDRYSFNSSETCIIEDEDLNEQRIHTEQLGNDVKKYGRIRGNMQYLEDLWNIEIRPMQFKYAYEKDGKLLFIKSKEARQRDKYIKIKVRYTGENLAVINGIMTMFDRSFA